MTPIPAEALKSHTAIIGKSGSGKTYCAKGVAEGLLDAGARVCIIDPTGVWWGMKSSASGKRGAYPIVVFGGAHADIQIGQSHGEAIAEVVGTSTTPVIIDTSLMKVGERTRFFADFGNTLIRANQGPLHLFIDEAHAFMPQGRVMDPQSANMLHAGNNLVSMGRARGLRITLITQRPAKLHKDALTQVETLVALRLIAPQDRRAIEEWIADQADGREGKEIIASLPSLPTGEGYVWAPELNILRRTKFPKIKTFDSSQTPDAETTGRDGLVLAPIDLAAINDRLDSVAQEATANDPVRLKKRIAELERAVSKGGAAANPEALAQAEQKGYERGKIDGYGEGLIHATDELQTRIDKAVDALKAVLKVEDKKIGQWRKGHKTAAPVLPSAPPAQKPAPRPQVAPQAQVNGLSGPEYKILSALAFWKSVGHDQPSKAQVAAVAGYSPNGGSFNTYLSRMRTNGMIETAAPGCLQLASNIETDSLSREQARDRLFSILGGPQRKIVDAFNGTEEMTRDELGDASGYQASGGSFGTYLSRLSSLQMIERHGGRIRLADWAREVLS